MKAYSKGTTVYWDWGQGTASGDIIDVFTEDVDKTIKGTQVKRKADDNAPAYLVEQQDGTAVLKGHSELSLTE